MPALVDNHLPGQVMPGQSFSKCQCLFGSEVARDPLNDARDPLNDARDHMKYFACRCSKQTYPLWKGGLFKWTARARPRPLPATVLKPLATNAIAALA